MTARIDGKHECIITSYLDDLKEMQQWCKDTFGYASILVQKPHRADGGYIAFIKNRRTNELETAYKTKFEFRDDAEAALFALTWRQK